MCTVFSTSVCLFLCLKLCQANLLFGFVLDPSRILFCRKVKSPASLGFRSLKRILQAASVPTPLTLLGSLFFFFSKKEDRQEGTWARFLGRRQSHQFSKPSDGGSRKQVSHIYTAIWTCLLPLVLEKNVNRPPKGESGWDLPLSKVRIEGLGGTEAFFKEQRSNRGKK